MSLPKATRVAGTCSLTVEEAATFAAGVRAHGGTVVFTNGVFDLLHPGHVRSLHAARDLGDALIVGVNSDRSVRTIKGPERPINPEAERVELLCTLRDVDAVVIFDEETPQALVAAVQPDVLVKGADWADRKDLPGRDVVEARGGRVVLVDLEGDFSTTNLIAKIRHVEQ